MLVDGGPDPPGPWGKGEGPPGPGVDEFDGAGDPGKGTEGGPDAAGPVKLFGGIVNWEGLEELALGPEPDVVCIGLGVGLLLSK